MPEQKWPDSRYPEQAEARAHWGKFYNRPPGGESWADVILRPVGLGSGWRPGSAGWASRPASWPGWCPPCRSCWPSWRS